ncbi:hypothetical protein Sxan_66350 [Streptomyces xanthophaeus]|uniref:Uncharacterized protein n=1 Tax=Streptomyces xanthophaeus TaxID=67385 RepID=A0A919LFR1_9ACTN|nr:hypothetical protein Sxan_66350 [Streptomyces xanthophaeus]
MPSISEATTEAGGFPLPAAPPGAGVPVPALPAPAPAAPAPAAPTAPEPAAGMPSGLPPPLSAELTKIPSPCT